MEKLNLPIIKNLDYKSRWLGMDEYLEFVVFNLKNCTDKKASKKLKKSLAVNAPFRLQ